MLAVLAQATGLSPDAIISGGGAVDAILEAVLAQAIGTSPNASFQASSILLAAIAAATARSPAALFAIELYFKELDLTYKTDSHGVKYQDPIGVVYKGKTLGVKQQGPIAIIYTDKNKEVS